MNKNYLRIIPAAVMFCTVFVGHACSDDSCFITVSIGSGSDEASSTAELLDTDCDGIPDTACTDCSPSYNADNCMRAPNGPKLGACIAGARRSLGEACTANSQCGPGGVCSMAQENTDGDGFGDACDYCSGKGAYDTDGDGWCDEDDTCPTVPNPLQEDAVCSGGIDQIAPFASFRGTWREIGRQIGRAYADNIIQFGQLFQTILSGFEPMEWTAQDYYQATELLIPQSIKDHMQGMAEGLVEVRRISPAAAWDLVLTQNMAIDLLNMENNRAPVPDSPASHMLHVLRGCTGFAVSSSAGTYLCHNTDAQGTPGVNTSVVMYWQPTNGDYAYMTFDPPGWADVAFGLNEQGIGVTVNAGSPNSGAVSGYYYTFMARYAMEHASTLDEAVAVFEDVFARGETFGPTGAIIHFVDFNTSRMAKIQLRSQDIEVTYGEERVSGVTSIASANHFVGEFNPDPLYYYESSWLRYTRLIDLLDDFPIYDLSTCWAIMSDTHDGTVEDDGLADSNTISRQGGFGGSSTTFGTIFTKDGMYYALGRPDAYFISYPEPQFVSASPTLIELSSFTAHPASRSVVIRWQTESEINNAGFTIYRADSPNSPYMQINPTLIPAKGSSTQGASYDFIDTNAQNRKTYWYKLADVDLNGTTTMHGPVSATPRLRHGLFQ